MDEFVANILKTWGMEGLIETFSTQEIDETVFTNLTESDISALIPTIGSRRKFLTKYKEYMKFVNVINDSDITLDLDTSFTLGSEASASATSESSSTSTGTIFSSEYETYDGSKDYVPNYQYPQKAILGLSYNISSSLGPKSDVRKLIDETEEGKIIAASYKKDKHFLRSKLCDLIIKNELKEHKDKRISAARFIELAKQINDIFPHEHPETYYVPYVNVSKGKPKAARGKLWSSYIYQRCRYKKLGFISTIKENSSEGTSLSKSTESTDETNEKIEEFLLYLKNSTLELTGTVIEYWKATTAARKTFNGSIDDYIKTYPILKLPLGYTLLEIDFSNLFTCEKDNVFYLKWGQIYKFILDKAKNKKDSLIQEVITEYTSKEHTEDTDQLFALTILPLLFPCTNLKVQKAGNKWKPSKKEMKDGFILHLKSLTDLDHALEIRDRRHSNYGYTNQPLPVIIGDIDNIELAYVIVNSVTYKVDTALKSVNLCFKVFHALNAEYPVEANMVWTFLQKSVFGISCPTDKHYVAVSSLMSDLEQFLSKDK